MHRNYSQMDQEFALERLVINRGNIAQTARELGISTRTLYRWRGMAKMSPLPLTTLTTLTPSSPNDAPPPYEVGRVTEGKGGGDHLPADDLQALLNLKTKMLDLADYIITNEQIKAAIDAAPLNQRIAALVQLIDRIAKLAAQLPAPKEEQVIRIAGDPEEIYDPNFGYTSQSTSEPDEYLSG